jgi:hypothetical protein
MFERREKQIDAMKCVDKIYAVAKPFCDADIFDLWLNRVELPGVKVKEVTALGAQDTLDPPLKKGERPEPEVTPAAPGQGKPVDIQVADGQL